MRCLGCCFSGHSKAHANVEIPIDAAKAEMVPIVAQVRKHAEAGIARAVMESDPEMATPSLISYAQLLSNIEEASKMIMALLAGRQPNSPKHVAYLISPGIAYVVVELAIWASGSTCVPLSVHSPPAELTYYLGDCEASVVVADSSTERKLQPVAEGLGKSFAVVTRHDTISYRLVPYDGTTIASGLVDAAVTDAALILYTSGTTGKPKGVVHTFQGLTAQYESLTEAWEWSCKDHTLHVLPLHHIHGVQNILNTAVFNGATVEFAPFDAAFCLKRLTSGDITCFHAVPTIYTKLKQHLDKLGNETQAEICKGLRHSAMRYMVSGSAALPIPTMKSWAEISGHVLLERYGMTEIGMALSNKLNGTRYPGCVGWPLPKVTVKLDQDGGILVKGATVFKEYYKREDATKEEFTEDGWFKTGDNGHCGGSTEEVQALHKGALEVERAACGTALSAAPDASLGHIYKIMGRSSIDIIKSGGYKISALEIENELLQHSSVKECAIVGKPDETWGEKVTAVCVLDGSLTLEELRKWAKSRLATYKVPQELEVVAALPRNQMGKIEKKRILDRYRAGERH